MEIDEQLAIMKAYINKIPIEVKHRLSTNKWKDLIYTNDYYFNFYEYEYRIKEEPKYRPYKTMEEAFNEAKKHGFWMREKDRKYMSIICRLSIKEIRVNNLDTTKEVVYINGDSSDYLLKNFVWADDNSPCGIKIQ